MEVNSLGVHLLLVPNDPAMYISQLSHADITAAVKTSANTHKCKLHGLCVRRDHIHVLIQAADENEAAKFVASLIREVGVAAKIRDPLFELSDGLHVTLLPPWHIDILNSFLRDQDHYHERHTVKDEIEQIFRPDGLPEQMADA